jgi:carnitine O-acetyltransferase
LTGGGADGDGFSHEGEPGGERDDKPAAALRNTPLPSLEESAALFTDWTTPALDNEQRAKTRAAVNEFVRPGGLGLRLQGWLERLSASSPARSWMDDYLDRRYLGRREPSIPGDNFFCLFRHEELDGVDRAAALVAAALNYKLVLDQQDEEVAAEIGAAASNGRIRRMFCASRVPHENHDELRRYAVRAGGAPEGGEDSVGPRHIIVFHRGNIYLLEVISISGVPHSLSDITLGLEAIVEKCLGEDQPKGRGIGNLATMWRNEWARARRQLASASPLNAASLEKIESAMFTLTLENAAPGSNLEACRHLMLGDAGNRWFDKSLQFIVFANGVAGVNIERAALEMDDVVALSNYILGVEPASLDHYSGAISQGLPYHEKLNFTLDAAMQKKIARMANAFEERGRNMSSRLFEFSDYGATQLAIWRISGEAVIHLALQLASYRAHGRLSPFGQMINMDDFADGRSQIMWTGTIEALDFVERMDRADIDDGEKSNLLRRALASVERRKSECGEGQAPLLHLEQLLHIHNLDPERFQSGFFSHLTGGEGLSAGEIRRGLEIFSSPGWKAMNEAGYYGSIMLSNHIICHGFAPALKEHGVFACNIFANSIICLVMLQGGGLEAEEELDQFVRYWRASLSDLGELIQKAQDV